MFTFVASVGLSSPGANRENITRMLAVTSSPGSDGTRFADAPNASAAVVRWHVVRRDRTAAPIWDTKHQLLFAGDVRLYNRRALLQELSLASEESEGLSDLGVAFQAYLKWGEASPKYLIGDFAFVAWNQGSRTLFAARDPLGIRPLYFSAQDDGLLVASDVQQLLPFVDRPHERINPVRVLDRFFPPVSQLGETYFRDIHSVQPGHILRHSRGSARQVRYWRPSLAIDERRSYGENCTQLRTLFQEAVRARLESDAPLIAHSSGGFDSSTILAVADEIYRREPERAPLTMVSGMVPGHPADDSPFMRAMAAQVSFPWIQWNVIAATAAGQAPVSLTNGSILRGPGGGPRDDLRIAKERSARVLLGGMLGDEVLYAGGIFMDMFRHGRWLKLLRETLVLRRPLARGGRLLAKALPGLLPPMMALQFQQRVFGRPKPRPSWLGPAIKDLYPQSPLEVDPGADAWPSHLALSFWARLTRPQISSLLDGIVAYGATEGIEVRLPFADVRIVEHLFSMPWQQRLPEGHLRRFGRDALGPVLPNEFNARLGQQSWTSVFEATNRQYQPYVAGVISAGPWLSEAYVIRNEAQKLLREAAARSDDPANAERWNLLMKFASLEAWLRALFCYNPTREVETCRTG